MANLANAISVQELGDCTAEARRARRKEFLVKKYSELSELCASVVNILHRKPGSARIFTCVGIRFRLSPSCVTMARAMAANFVTRRVPERGQV